VEIYNIETFKTCISTRFTPITSEKREFVIIPNYDRVALVALVNRGTLSDKIFVQKYRNHEKISILKLTFKQTNQKQNLNCEIPILIIKFEIMSLLYYSVHIDVSITF